MKITSIFNLLPAKVVFAHCDIPCGIYDAHQAQMAAHTIIRMNQLIDEVSVSGPEPPFEERKKIISQVSRLTHVKEEHSNILEHELVTLEKDYFKEEHFEKFANLRELFESASKLGAKARVGIDIDSAKELLETVIQIAEIFYKTKGLEPFRTKSPYPTELEYVLHK